MTKSQINVFSRSLEKCRHELENGNRNREALTIETASDDLDRVQYASARDSAMETLERTSGRLREVRHALRRIQAGTFGICGGCDEPINPRRLAALPWAFYCVVCQESADREQQPGRIEFHESLLMTA